MLEIVFDVLEGNLISLTMSSTHKFSVLRYLRSNRSDISKGNILYIEEQTTTPGDARCGVKNTEPKEVPLRLIIDQASPQ